MIRRLALAAALWLGLALPASATNLFSCGEDIDCVLQGTVAIGTTAGHFVASYARLSSDSQIGTQG
jgi:hypothetical protein